MERFLYSVENTALCQCYIIFAVLILDRSLYTSASLFPEMKIPLLRRSAINKDIYPLIVLSPT